MGERTLRESRGSAGGGRPDGGGSGLSHPLSRPGGHLRPPRVVALIFLAVSSMASLLAWPVLAGAMAGAEAQTPPLQAGKGLFGLEERASLSGDWTGQDAGGNVLGAQIWFPRGPEPTLRTGETVGVHFRAEREGYVVIAQLDTAGRVHLHFPSGPRDPQWIRGGQEHLLLLRGGRPWVVADGPGLGHFFILTSDRPLDWSRLGYTEGRGWDLSGAMAPDYADPNDAMDDLVWAILPGWEEADFALDLASYRVVRRR